MELVDEVLDVDERAAHQLALEPVTGDLADQLHVPADVELRLAIP